VTKTFSFVEPIVDPSSFDTEEIHKKKVEDIIASYTESLAVKTENHLGYPYNLNFDYGPLSGIWIYMKFIFIYLFFNFIL
jgi:histidine decarboxylase